MSADTFHEIADRAVTSATEILAIAETSDTEADPVKAGLRHKVVALGHIVNDMRLHIGEPLSSPDTPPLPITRADLDKLETCMRDCRLLYSALSAIIAVDCANESKIDEAIINDIAELLRDQASRIWDNLEELSIGIRGRLIDNGQLETLE
ncbi:hypothetical protein ABZN20_10165 [Methylococcus sp. ANG]|uniref:hypothetical protein n=1 Tax=Methylococcus sp. ANG TaxID=3231903 RepID=UPI003458B6C8